MKFIVKTLGCKANYSDGQLIEAGLIRLGHQSTQKMEDADYVIVNSCTVTNEADVQSQKMARDSLKKNPYAKVIYTGCAAEIDPEKALQIPGVAAVIGNQNKDRASELIQEYISSGSETGLLGSVSGYSELISRHPIDREWAMPDSAMDEVLRLNPGHSTYRTRVFIKIQEGCNAFCTYCIIPYGRGPSRSLSIETIVQNVRELCRNGVQEIILTGTNIGDYGVDQTKQSLIDDLIEAILQNTDLKRLRVSSLDPTEISDRMIELMDSEERFCPHFHLSLQNIQSQVLKLMKRKYSELEARECLSKISAMKRKPFVGVDYIVGFPGETRECFDESIEKLKTLYWSRLHVFPYSERNGTPATRLPGIVPVGERKARARILQELSLERLVSVYRNDARKTALKGVLLESRVKGPDGTLNWISGYAPNYQRVILPASEGSGLENTVQDIQVKQWVVDRASGEVSWLGDRLQ